MEESKELKNLYTFLQGAIYLTIVIEIIALLNFEGTYITTIKNKLKNIVIYQDVLLSKLFTILLVLIVSVGSKPKKAIEINIKKSIALPFIFGLLITITSVYFLKTPFKGVFFGLQANLLLYIFFSFIGVLLVHIGADNISKIIRSSFMKDRFNIENESFEQPKEKVESEFSVNIPMLFYFKKRLNKGWINIEEIFRGLIVIGTPGSGKTFGVIVPYIKQLISKGFTMLIYDYKYPDLTKMAYFYFLKYKKKYKNLRFHVINLSDVEYSRRVNPLLPKYVGTLSAASETAETLVHSLQKSDKSGGAERFFTQSAVNFLAAVIYFFAKYENGKYSTFSHVLNFISKDYEDIFNVLYSNDELEELLSPFKVAYDNKTFGQLDAQIGTLRIFLSRLASKESAWIFTGNDFDLKISSKENPSIIVIANLEETQSINSASNALILNRITKLINTEGNLPSAVVVDESPTIYIHKIDKLISTARSRKVAVLLGLQELPQLVAGYGKETADTIISIMGNIISGAVRKKETLQWLQQIFGKVKQETKGMSIGKNVTLSVNEKMDYLIPESKISNLQKGEVVGQIVRDQKIYTGKYKTGSYNCKINLDVKQIEKEQQQYKKPIKYYDFQSNEQKELILTKNYTKVKNEIKMLLLDHQ